MAEPSFLLSSEAKTDLHEIAVYIAERSGRGRARSVVERISRTLAAIAYTPNAGRLRSDLDGHPFLFSIPPWIVLYEPDPELSGIYVLRIYDGRRDLDSVLGDYRRPNAKP